MRIFIDIETCPTADPVVMAEIEAGITPPGNMSKLETIAAWERDKKPAAVAEAIGKTALDAATGSIISIGVGRDEGEPTVIMRPPEDPDDRRLLRDFFNYVNDILEDASMASPTTGELIYRPEPWFVAHNAAFDLEWLWRRAVIHEIAPPFPLPAPDEHRHGKTHYCTMTAWAGHRGTISLSRLCRALGITDPKANDAGISGANAWEFWQRGDLDTVDAYNRADVIATRAIFHRLEAMTARRAA